MFRITKLASTRNIPISQYIGRNKQKSRIQEEKNIKIMDKSYKLLDRGFIAVGAVIIYSGIKE